MRLGVVVSRLNQIRHVEGLLREAHRRGWETALLLDHLGPDGQGEKARATVDTIPTRIHDLCWRVVPVEDVGRTFAVDAAVSIPWHRPFNVPFAAQLQTTVSDILEFTDARRWDRVYGWSAAWPQFWARATRMPASRRHELGDRFVPVGFPLAEHLTWLDRDLIRARWGLPARAPIVLYLPFPFGMHGQSWRIKGLYRYAPWGDRATFQAVRRFCDRHGAVLVVKHRLKGAPLPGYVRDGADLLIETDQPGEPTVLHLLSVSRLLIHHMSAAVAEAAAAGVRAISVVPRGWTAYERRGEQLGADFAPDGTQSFYGWSGLSVSWPPAWMRRRELDEGGTTVDPIARAAYLDHFLGGEPFCTGARICDDLEKAVR